MTKAIRLEDGMNGRLLGKSYLGYCAEVAGKSTPFQRVAWNDGTVNDIKVSDITYRV
jgi:hypothetical protein